MIAARALVANQRDVRVHDVDFAWVHATAHTADLLKFLARESDWPPAEQARFLAALDAMLRGGRHEADATWTAGEDLRLARVALSLVKRGDFDSEAFERWIAGFEAAHSDLWRAPRLDGNRLAQLGNRRRVLVELSVLLAGDDQSELVVWAASRVLRALRETG